MTTNPSRLWRHRKSLLGLRDAFKLCCSFTLMRKGRAIMVNPEGGYIGASESRKDGHAAGY